MPCRAILHCRGPKLCMRAEAGLCACQVARLEEQLSRLMQSMPSDVSVTSKSTTPLSPPLQSSPTLAKSGRRRSAFELVRSSRACACLPYPLL